MKRILKQTLALASLVLLSGGAYAQVTGIAATPHNLSSTGTVGNNRLTNAGTDQICVFCHTPHGASMADEAPPLWNKNLKEYDATFKTYADTQSSSIDGTILTIGSVSVACLSCHDGTQAMDNIINAPGRDGFSTGGAADGLQGATWIWQGPRVGAEGRLEGFANLKDASDLQNDHPIGIQYCGGGLNESATDAADCRDGDFKSVQTRNINNQDVFWVETGLGGANRDKQDIILYTRDFGTDGKGPSVECASCHDPHVESKGTDNINFMRVSTAGSAICLACHVK